MEVLAVAEVEWDFSSISIVSWEKEGLLAAFLNICRAGGGVHKDGEVMRMASPSYYIDKK